MTITTSASIGGAIGERKLRRGFSLQYKGASIMYKKGKKSYGKKGKKSSYGKKKKR